MLDFKCYYFEFGTKKKPPSRGRGDFIKTYAKGLFLPEFFHFLQRFAFGFRNHFPDKHKRKNTHQAIKAVSQTAAEFHHSRIGRRDEIVGSPLCSYCNCNGTTSWLVLFSAVEKYSKCDLRQFFLFISLRI